MFEINELEFLRDYGFNIDDLLSTLNESNIEEEL